MDIELDDNDDAPDTSFVDEFFTTVADIKGLLNEIDYTTKNLEAKYNESFATVKSQDKLKGEWRCC